MIKTLRGTASLLGEKSIVIEVNNVGYEVWVPAHSISGYAIGSEYFFHISHIVREDSETLYGFPTMDERDFFELLISVSGIGPKSALGIMSVAPIETLARAIAGGDVGYLTKVSGVGKKTAEKVILELRDKVLSGSGESQGHGDAFEALESLGYQKHDIRHVLSKLQPGTTEEQVKEALKLLSKGH